MIKLVNNICKHLKHQKRVCSFQLISMNHEDENLKASLNNAVIFLVGDLKIFAHNAGEASVQSGSGDC